MLAFTLLVIIWGAYVRATGSGAGCGSHWPLCNGELLPEIPHHTTFIEFAHRVTSGMALLLVVAHVVYSRRLYPAGSPVRLACWLALFFMIIESLLGAGLVVFELVADNTTIARAVWMALHLINTFLLLAPLALVAWWASGGQPIVARPARGMALLMGGALAGTLLLGTSGAVTALGDTLFPAASLAEGIQQDFSPTAHILIRLRLFHPAIAALVGVYLVMVVWLVYQRVQSREGRSLARLLAVLFGGEVLVGIINVLLMAPVAVQLLHLLLATLIWISLVLLTHEALACSVVARRQAVPTRPVSEPLQLW